MGDTKKNESAENVGCGFLLLMVVAFAISGYSEWNKIPTGSQCALTRSVYGMRDLGKAYEALKKAVQAKDDWGIDELSRNGQAIRLSEGTPGLVIDTEFQSDDWSHYRQLRILSGPDAGKALWVRRDVLQSLKN
jgi:hypothetical protein